MSKPITKYEEKVMAILEKSKRARDNDNYLFCYFLHGWLKEAQYDPDTLPTKDLLNLLSFNGNAPSFESISRCRRKLQENHKELRGELYNERRGLQEDVKEDLGYQYRKPDYPTQDPELFPERGTVV